MCPRGPRAGPCASSFVTRLRPLSAHRAPWQFVVRQLPRRRSWSLQSHQHLRPPLLRPAQSFRDALAALLVGRKRKQKQVQVCLVRATSGQTAAFLQSLEEPRARNLRCLRTKTKERDQRLHCLERARKRRWWKSAPSWSFCSYVAFHLRSWISFYRPRTWAFSCSSSQRVPTLWMDVIWLSSCLGYAL